MRFFFYRSIHDYRQGDIQSAEFSDEFNKLLNCVSDTAAAEMRAAYKVGFKDGATMMQEIQD